MPKNASSFNFETSMKNLQEIVESLSSTPTSLNDSFALYEKGVELYLSCLEYIKTQEEKISILKNKADVALNKEQQMLLEDFDLDKEN